MKNINLELEKQRDTGLTNNVRPPNFVHEKQEIEKQKLEGWKRRQNYQWKSHLTKPKVPSLHTSLRTRPLKIKSPKEVEKEQHEKPPQFKARPLNKKILDSKGDLGLFCIKKRQVTIPQEFHFAIDERIPLPRIANNAKFYEKIASCLESQIKKPIPRNTIPRPFHLQTQERGARIPKSYPYPSTTDNLMIEDENALTQLGNTLITHARQVSTFKQSFLHQKFL